MISVRRSERGQTRPAGTGSAHRTQSLDTSPHPNRAPGSTSPHPNRAPSSTSPHRSRTPCSLEHVHCTQVANRPCNATRNRAELEPPEGGVDAPALAEESVSLSALDFGWDPDDELPPGAWKPADWWCGLCAKSFRNGDLLTMHVQLVHKELEPSAAVGGMEQGTGASSASWQRANSGTGALPSPSIARGFAVREQADADPDYSQSGIHSLCSNSSQAPRPLPRSSESGVEEFLAADAQNRSLHNAQGANPAQSILERGGGPYISDSSHSLDPRWRNFVTGKSQEAFAHSSHAAAAQGTDGGTGSLLGSSPHAAGLSATQAPGAARRPPVPFHQHAGRVQKSPMGRRCRHCQKIVHLDAGQFQEHEQRCVKQRVGLDCPQCGRSFASKVALKDHVDSLHSRKGFQCRACGMVFKWRTYVYQHRYKCAAYRVKKEPQ